MWDFQPHFQCQAQGKAVLFKKGKFLESFPRLDFAHLGLQPSKLNYIEHPN